MDLSRISKGEIIAIVGGLLLGLSVFVKWYEATSELVKIEGQPNGFGTYSAFDVHPILRILLLLAAIAPLILAYIIVRDHTLSWPRGQVTMIVGIAAIGLIFYSGIVDRPGTPSGEIELEIGWYGAALGSILMVVGSVRRQAETETKRKPPGSI